MSDDAPIPILNEDGTPDTSNDLVNLGQDGDPLALDKAVKMRERESYERIVEGLKIAADAAAHLKRSESEHAGMWDAQRRNLDQARRAAVQYAGIDDPVRQSETADPRGSAHMGWKEARERFREGLKQASGGMRQLATCFRGDVFWSLLAQQLEALEQKVMRRSNALATRKAVPLLLPDGALLH